MSKNYQKENTQLKKEIGLLRKKYSFLKKILAIMPGNLYWKDRKGVFLGCNRNLAKIHQLNSADEIIGKDDYDLLDKESADTVSTVDSTVMNLGKEINVEERGFDINKKPAVYFTKKTPILDENNKKIIGMAGISIDITDLKKREAELKQAKEQAEKANQLKSDFISNMEHDIRTPLGGIYGMMDILARQENDPEKKSIMGEMTACAKELMDFCNGILDFSKIEAEAFPVVSKSFEFRKLINSVVNIEMMAAKNKSLDLLAEFDKKLPKVVISDPYRIKRILLNLVSNAIKFTKQGGIKISVTLDKENTKNRKIIVKFIVSDTGIGIPDDKKALIYERFTKVIPSSKGLYKGLGLGLRIVKQFMDELDGDIHLKSEIGKGSIFTLLLPLKIPLSNEIIDEE